MYKFFVNTNQIKEGKIKIINDDVNHIKNVLRLNKEEKIEVSDSSSGESYICKILEYENNTVVCEIIEKIEKKSESKIYLHILQGLPKSDKMEMIIQKCTELGVKEFTPVALNRCIVKLNGKDEFKKIERWQKISEVAAKQSKRNIVPKVNYIIKLNKVIELIKEYDIMLVAYEEQKTNTIK
ncbi:MAG: 16S rRNA (uracil(1498)-N(3))-methyltransferase, partial [Clostridia bacterium]|nr:16S rRNA (uracil(1498)-N(3))-methyltransferase [Clostridia bacterium]